MFMAGLEVKIQKSRRKIIWSTFPHYNAQKRAVAPNAQWGKVDQLNFHLIQTIPPMNVNKNFIKKLKRLSLFVENIILSVFQ